MEHLFPGWWSSKAAKELPKNEGEAAPGRSLRTADVPLPKEHDKPGPLHDKSLDDTANAAHTSDSQTKADDSVQPNVVANVGEPRQRKRSGRKNFVETKISSVPTPEEQLNIQSETIPDHALDWLNTDYGTTLPKPQRPPDRDVSPDQLRAWKTFTFRLSSLVEKRVQADEIRRRARLKRQAFVETLKGTLDGAQESVLQAAATQTVIPEVLAEALSELERSELRLEEVEDELVQAESAIEKSLPVISGPQADKTFEFLQQSALDFRSVSDESEDSLRSDIVDDVDFPPERQRLLAKLDEVNSLEEQLIELRADRQHLQTWDEADLTSKEITFLECYHDENAKLKRSLNMAKAELEKLTEILQRSVAETSSPRAVEPAVKNTDNLAILSLDDPS